MRRLAAAALLLALLAPLPALLLAGGTGEGTPLLPRLLAAAVAALAATALGGAAGMGLHARFRGRGAAFALVALPLLLPPVLPGAALLLAGERTETGGLPGTVLWHVLLGAPLVAGLVMAALGRIDPALFRAAQACGATPDLAARRILRPRLLPALAAGAALSFALSVGEGTVAAMLEAGAPVTAAPILSVLVVLGMLLLALLARPKSGTA
ncbi:hypothetical protein [Muricoccus vinaceus]|uniref:ABC transmembrane type-1 domain-containing protein n=1 Tax=Muricoccus vinaceus TaxID=424704 RepID=A0ABV6IXN9_9PROT